MKDTNIYGFTLNYWVDEPYGRSAIDSKFIEANSEEEAQIIFDKLLEKEGKIKWSQGNPIKLEVYTKEDI